ncbi:MAG TPA: nucleoside 2-deoxyribosyltransferase [Candidatus Paceibacterota bacterium]|nr:nucleoside 2-deoxyribosyltransferase [Candidatus Paceibacterota bacterium]
MKIYFAGSIRGGRDDQKLYEEIIAEVGAYGTVLTEHIGHLSLTDGGETHITNEEIFARDMAWVREADAIVAEVSTPSLGVGYELGQAVALGKPILCLFRPQEGKRLSAMVAGNPDLRIYEYQSREDAARILKEFFANFT